MMTATPAVTECAYPGCRQGPEQTPRLTQNTICISCRNHYRHTLDWLTLDWITLRQFPKPTSDHNHDSESKHGRPESPGHPAEWASDLARLIADTLNETEDDLRDHNHHAPAVNPFTLEQIRIRNAHHYLTNCFDSLCTHPAAGDLATSLHDLHRRVRSGLGLTRVAFLLPTPCPWCDVAALVRSQDQIDCRNCGKTVQERHYEWFANLVIDAIIAEYDTQKAASV